MRLWWALLLIPLAGCGGGGGEPSSTNSTTGDSAVERRRQADAPAMQKFIGDAGAWLQADAAWGDSVSTAFRESGPTPAARNAFRRTGPTHARSLAAAYRDLDGDVSAFKDARMRAAARRVVSLCAKETRLVRAFTRHAVAGTASQSEFQRVRRAAIARAASNRQFRAAARDRYGIDISL